MSQVSYMNDIIIIEVILLTTHSLYDVITELSLMNNVLDYNEMVFCFAFLSICLFCVCGGVCVCAFFF